MTICNFILVGGENMTLKHIKTFVAVILPLLLILLSRQSVYADKLDVTLSYPKEVQSGRSFEIKINLNSDVDIGAVQLSVSYVESNISFKSVQCQSGESYSYEEAGKTEIICLFSNGVSSGELATISLTSQSGSNGSQTIDFSCVQAVSLDLNEVDVNIENSAVIEIVSSSSGGKSNSVSHSKTTSSRQNISSSAKSSASKNSAKSSEILSSGKSYSDTLDSNIKGDSVIQYGNSREDVGYLTQGDKKVSYVMAGVGITLSVLLILFVVFRAGQMSKKK